MSDIEIKTEIDRLAALPFTDCCLQIKEAAAKLRMNKTDLDRCVKEARREAKAAAAVSMADGELIDDFTGKRLEIGSDCEVAQRIVGDMLAEATFVGAKGAIYRWGDKRWVEVEPIDIQRKYVGAYDGARYGMGGVVRLDQRKVKSIMSFVSQELTIKDFFAGQPRGINCVNGFVQFGAEGEIELVPHHPDHKCRSVLRGSYDAAYDGKLPEGSLLAKFLSVLPYDDPEQSVKHLLLQEAFGVAVAGMATHIAQPKAIVLFGRSANNGKSAVLDLLEGLLGSCAHVSAHELNNMNIAIQLRGHYLNCAAELTSAHAVSGEVFKKVITGDPCYGKILYQDVVVFRPVALNMYAANRLPPFSGGLDPGVGRRLIVLAFENSIPLCDQVENIVAEILEHEYSLLLSWAIAGAQRIIERGGFTIPPSSVHALQRWMQDVDAVKCWIVERVRESNMAPKIDPGYQRKDAYDLFLSWATENHYDRRKLPGMHEFVDRLAEVFPLCKRTSDSRRLRGISIMLGDPLDGEDSEPSTDCGNGMDPSPYSDRGGVVNQDDLWR